MGSGVVRIIIYISHIIELPIVPVIQTLLYNLANVLIVNPHVNFSVTAINLFII